jgi:hypothetical protein
MGRIDGDYIYDASGRTVARTDGSTIYDPSGSQIGSVR